MASLWRRQRLNFAASNDTSFLESLFSKLSSTGVEGIPRILVIHSGMVIVDEYWHTFILHTRDYEQFCKDYLGTFIHHSPGTPDFQPPSREETELQLNYICEVVGEDTMIRWYEEYPVKYSAEVLAKLQKPRLFDRPCEAVAS